MTQSTVCYIDDKDSNLRLIEKSLSDKHRVVTINSSQNAVDRLLGEKPDLVLLDVNMPGCDGYEVCRNIRGEIALKDVPIVFLTCRTELKDRLTGFEAGGDAYITKPYQLDELKLIVRSQIDRYQNYQALENKAQSSNDMVWMMMQNNSEQGQVVQYARELAHINDAETLLQKTFSTLNSFGLNSTLLFRLTAGEVICRFDRKPFTPLEAELLQLARNGERIVAAGTKYLFKGNYSIFLIKNMPVDDEALCGRLRDHLAIMIESCDACIELMNYRHKERQAQQDATNNTEQVVSQEFDNIITLFESLNQRAKTAFDRLAMNIEEYVPIIIPTKRVNANPLITTPPKR